MDIQFDKYPYTASSTSLDSLLPKWAHEGGTDATLSRLSDPAMHQKILRAVTLNNEGEKGWESILLAFSGCEKYQAWEGETLAEIARKTRMEPFDLFIDLLVRSRLATAICGFSMCQEDTDMAILHRCGLVCSDSSAWAPYGALSRGKPHPRAYGTFPKFFRDYVKERPLLALEEAVAKVTSKSAERFGLKKRGRVSPGYFADLVILDWEQFLDTATYANPHQYPTGVAGVVVNGVVTLWRESLTGKRAGRILARSSSTR
jgi:N-acyl-D-amino-acid deacylase